MKASDVPPLFIRLYHLEIHMEGLAPIRPATTNLNEYSVSINGFTHDHHIPAILDLLWPILSCSWQLKLQGHLSLDLTNLEIWSHSPKGKATVFYALSVAPCSVQVATTIGDIFLQLSCSPGSSWDIFQEDKGQFPFSGRQAHACTRCSVSDPCELYLTISLFPEGASPARPVTICSKNDPDQVCVWEIRCRAGFAFWLIRALETIVD